MWNGGIALDFCREVIRDLRESSLLPPQRRELAHVCLLWRLSGQASLPDGQRLNREPLRLRVPSGHERAHRLELHEQILVHRRSRPVRLSLNDGQFVIGSCDIALLDEAMKQPPVPAA